MKKKLIFSLICMLCLAGLITGCGKSNYKSYHTIINDNYKLKVGIIDGWYDGKNSWAKKNNDTATKMWLINKEDGDASIAADEFFISLNKFSSYQNKQTIIDRLEYKITSGLYDDVAYTKSVITKKINGYEVYYVIITDDSYIWMDANIFIDKQNYIDLSGRLMLSEYKTSDMEKYISTIVNAFVKLDKK